MYTTYKSISSVTFSHIGTAVVQWFSIWFLPKSGRSHESDFRDMLPIQGMTEITLNIGKILIHFYPSHLTSHINLVLIYHVLQWPKSMSRP